MFEKTFISSKAYADPFNEVELDVIFEKDDQAWRVPTFWRGGQRWTVRFAPPTPGEYTYRLQSTDSGNPDLNGQETEVPIAAYQGNNPLLQHGALRVSANKRHFEHADGRPFYWLGDTWWMGLSERISWEGFQELTADRKAKGFTVVQLVAGLTPWEDIVPSGPGSRNEGGQVWDDAFTQINPSYFDYADRRIRHLIDAGMVPAIVGGWCKTLDQIGVEGMKKHWRYLIACYGAYPVFWIAGGEVYDPPEAVAQVRTPTASRWLLSRGWTEVTRYLRATDPYRHPLTVHEVPPPMDVTLQEQGLQDFRMIQPGHFGWKSMEDNVAQLTSHYTHHSLKQPVVQGEIGYEGLGAAHREDFQRAAFWLSMLNGAAGHTYGAGPTFEFNNPALPLHSNGQYSFLTWQEGMRLPGSDQVGFGASLLKRYRWWEFMPHPEWIAPRGTVLFDPIERLEMIDISREWKSREGNARLPYAAGIAGEARFVYVPPQDGLYTFDPYPVTVLGLEPHVRYHAFWWDPTLGIQFDLGTVERPPPGVVLFEGTFHGKTEWAGYGMDAGKHIDGRFVANQDLLRVLPQWSELNVVAEVEVRSEAPAALVLRYENEDNCILAQYSAKEQAVYLVHRKAGIESEPLGKTSATGLDVHLQLRAEVRGAVGIVSVTDGRRSCTSPIVDISGAVRGESAPILRAGSVGISYRGEGATQRFGRLEVRASPELHQDESLDRQLYDARGRYRGEMRGEGWDEFGRGKTILLDAYRPDRLPSAQDWVLVLEVRK